MDRSEERSLVSNATNHIATMNPNMEMAKMTDRKATLTAETPNRSVTSERATNKGILPERSGTEMYLRERRKSTAELTISRSVQRHAAPTMLFVCITVHKRTR